MEILNHMRSTGIRIKDIKKNGVISPQLPDFLEEVQKGDSIYWSILFLDAMGNLGEGRSLPVFEQQIYDSENGLSISWDDLNALSRKFYQIIDMVLIGSRDKHMIRRYKEDQDRNESCDYVIDMFDSSYWEVFSKDEEFFNRLVKKFKDVEFLNV